MPAPHTARRRAAFLTALAQTGNLTIAAERVKVSRPWARLLRKRDPEFDAAVRAALATFAAGVAHGEADPHPTRPAGEPAPANGKGAKKRMRYHQGEELVLLGEGLGTRIQLIRARPKQWTERLERRFLEVLANTCNAAAACRAIGLTYSSAHQR